MIVIPSNTTNCISRVGEKSSQFRTSYLFLGSLKATEPAVLTQYAIRAVLTVGMGLGVMVPAGIAHKVIIIEDHPQENIAQFFSECNAFITEHLEKGNVLVHCAAGMSRSASVVLAYTMKMKKMRLSQAYEKVRQARNIINPNQGFMNQLKQYERKLRKAWTNAK